MVESWESFEERVVKAIRANSIIFLRRAADEIARHGDGADSGFDHETGTIVTVLTQMALELAAASFLVRHEGIRSILAKPGKLTDDQIRDQWFDNELRTKTFEDCKQLLSAKYPGNFGAVAPIVDMFQKSRNKIMHLHFKFADADLYDLKFEATAVLIHAVSHLIFENEFDHSCNLSSILSPSTFSKLVRFRPYVYHAERLAKEYSKIVLRCPICEQVAFSDEELKCFACTYEDSSVRLLFCPACSNKSVIYDHGNLPLNLKLPSMCLKCGDRREVFGCTSCREPVIGGPPYLTCAACTGAGATPT
jgi:hypothetical protein